MVWNTSPRTFQYPVLHLRRRAGHELGPDQIGKCALHTIRRRSCGVQQHNLSSLQVVGRQDERRLHVARFQRRLNCRSVGIRPKDRPSHRGDCLVDRRCGDRCQDATLVHVSDGALDACSHGEHRHHAHHGHDQKGHSQRGEHKRTAPYGLQVLIPGNQPQFLHHSALQSQAVRTRDAPAALIAAPSAIGRRRLTSETSDDPIRTAGSTTGPSRTCPRLPPQPAPRPPHPYGCPPFRPLPIL